MYIHAPKDRRALVFFSPFSKSILGSNVLVSVTNDNESGVGVLLRLKLAISLYADDGSIGRPFYFALIRFHRQVADEPGDDALVRDGRSEKRRLAERHGFAGVVNDP